MFYLMARGIPEKEAEALLIQAFVGEAIEGIEHAGLRDALMEQVVAWLQARGSMTHASGSEQRRLRRQPHPRGFPDPRHAGLRQAAGLSRQRRLGAEAEGGARPHPAGLHVGIRQRASRPALSRQCRDRRLRGRAREGARRSSTRRAPEEIIFTRNATEAINLVAYTFGRERIKPGDEIVLSIMEHHSNIVPWHFLRERHGAVIKWAPVDDEGNFLIDEFEKLLTPRTKMVAITHMSNMLGTLVPVKEVVQLAHARGIPVLVDGARAAVHLDVDVQDIDCDFYVFTGHKLYGPTGIGVLYGKYDLLAAMPPFNGGGEMIRDVFEDRVTYGDPPHRFEAGTPPIVQAIGLGAAIDYVNSIGKARIRAHEARCVGLRPRAACARSIRCGSSATAQGQGPDRVVRDEGRASARCRDHHRPLRRRGARRHPLRDAAARAFRRHGDLPGLVRALQHQGRGRQPGARAGQGAGDFRMTRRTDPQARRRRRSTKPKATRRCPRREIARMTDDIVAALKTVYDPEIPADIYELGLIYKVDIEDDRSVKVDMTLTTPNCPSAAELPMMVENAVASVPGVSSAKSTWSGIRRGIRAGCRTRRGSCSTCGELRDSRRDLHMVAKCLVCLSYCNSKIGASTRARR